MEAKRARDSDEPKEETGYDKKWNILRGSYWAMPWHINWLVAFESVKDTMYG